MRDMTKLSEANRNRTLGCLVGGAVGDALGYAVEFDSWNSIQGRYGPEGITRFELSPASYQCRY